MPVLNSDSNKSEHVKNYIDSFFSASSLDVDGDISPCGEVKLNSQINYNPPLDDHALVMVCSVAGRKFCVSMISLICVIRAENYPLAPCLNYFMADIEHAGKKYMVIDLGVKVRNKDMRTQPYEGYVVLCDNGVALYCDKIIDNRSIDYRNVTWRTKRYNTPWNAGIDSDSTTMVIDIEELHVLR